MVCNGSCSSTRNTIPLFNKENGVHSNNTLIETIKKVLNRDIVDDGTQTQVICKKCFKLFDEADELERRLREIKSELSNNIGTTSTNQKKEEIAENGEQTDPDPSNQENELPRKILDIPSSDDETSQVIIDNLLYTGRSFSLEVFNTR